MSGTRYQVCLYEISHRISVCGKFAKLRTFPPSLTLHRRTLELRVVGIEICCTPSFTEESYAELKDLSMSRLHAQERIITSCVDLAPTLLNVCPRTSQNVHVSLQSRPMKEEKELVQQPTCARHTLCPRPGPPRTRRPPSYYSVAARGLLQLFLQCSELLHLLARRARPLFTLWPHHLVAMI